MHSAGTQNVRAPARAASGAAAETAQPSLAVRSSNGGESPASFESRGRGSGRGQGDPVSGTAEMSARGRGGFGTAGLSRGSKGKQKGPREAPGRRWWRRAGPGPARHTGRAASARLHRLQRARSRLRASRPGAPGGCRWGKLGTGAARASLPGCFALALALPCLARPAPRAWPASPERRRAPPDWPPGRAQAPSKAAGLARLRSPRRWQ